MTKDVMEKYKELEFVTEKLVDYCNNVGIATACELIAVEAALERLYKARQKESEKDMANSTQQARNIDGALEISSERLPRGPVLLVDDMVDSRWTLTVSAWLLRKHGSGPVWPLALSQTGHDE